jgi:hypothetical protein
MTPEQAGKALDAAVAKIIEAGEADRARALQTAANRAAVAIQRLADQAGDSIDVKTDLRGNKITITVYGKNSSKYRALLNRAIDAQMPQATIDLKSSITGWAK